mmetsp:Transcript_21681/g.43834  ORF Transcript_21681/g.43834 Transcript_21681/m.43834 type:complete len:297 (-) Transcript_21681:352-1242(-)
MGIHRGVGRRHNGQLTVIGLLNALPFAVAYGTERAVFSKIANAECALQLSVGRIPGTAMPPEWASSGAKLGLALEIEFSDEPCAEYEMTKERLLGSGSFRAVEPLTVPSFVSTKGQETVKVTQGAYGCQLERLEAQQFSFRFFLDFPDGAVRNDVELPAERIYFMSSCWIENKPALERAQKRRKDMERSLRETQDQLLQLGQESNLFQKALSLRQTTTLVEQKDMLQRQLTELTQSYPLDPSMYVRGPNGLLFAKKGVIAVKRYRGALGTREQYHWVGTFAFRQFFEFEDDEEEDV